jgi:ankyrin repeat protein
MSGWKALHLAVWNMHTDVIALLLNCSLPRIAEIEPTSHGWSALHLAVWNNDIDVIHRLLKAGADKFCKDNIGRTPMHWAAIAGHVDAIHALKIDTDFDRTPPDTATRTKFTDVQTLTEVCPSVSSTDEFGLTPVDLAAIYGQTHAFNSLLYDVQADDSGMAWFSEGQNMPHGDDEGGFFSRGEVCRSHHIGGVDALGG